MKLLKVSGKKSAATFHLNLDFCRICMASEEIVSMDDDFEDTKLSDVFTQITGISISKDDGLPGDICMECVGQIKYICDFKKRCLDTDQKLRQMLGSTDGDYITVEEGLEPDAGCQLEEDQYVAIEGEEFIDTKEVPGPSEQKSDIVKLKSEIDYQDEVEEDVIIEEDFIEEDIIQEEEGEEYIKVEYLNSDDLEYETDNSNVIYEYEDVDDQETVELLEINNFDNSSMDDEEEHVPQHHKSNIKIEKETVITKKSNSTGVGKISVQKKPIVKRKFKTTTSRTGEDKLKVHQCSFCGKLYHYHRQLQEHINVHTGNRPYECNICNKRFFTQSTLHSHGAVHKDVKPYKCDICGKSFARSNNFKSHQFLHTGEKPHECEVCGKAFKTIIHLRGHMRVHTGEKPYKCDSCDKAYSHYTDLKRHKYIHTGERPYKCTVCTKGFTKRSNLDIHMQTHSGERPYECNLCIRKFTQPNMLKAHLKAIHDV